MATTTSLAEMSATVLGPSPRAVAILRIGLDEVLGPVMHGAPVPDLTAPRAVIDAQTTSEPRPCPGEGAASSRRVSPPRRGRTRPTPTPGLW